MINIIDIKKAVNNIIKKEFSIPLLSNRVKDNFKTPAFFTKVKPNLYEYETKIRHEESYSIEIHYFPNRIYDEEDLMKVLTKLRKVFDRKLKVRDRKLNIINIRESIHEGTLFFRFNLNFQQYKDIPETSTIDEIVINRKDG